MFAAANRMNESVSASGAMAKAAGYGANTRSVAGVRMYPMTISANPAAETSANTPL